MSKRMISTLAMIGLGCVLLFGSVSVASARSTLNDLLGRWGSRGASTASDLTGPQAAVAPSQAAVTVTTSGALMTQTFTLQAGWNTIYLEVEPINSSPLVNEGSAEEPIWAHEQSTVEAVFSTLGCDACLESVWRWNVPLSRMDYIVDPAEGLWDKPGWMHYFPETSLGLDGESLEFLTNLFGLHANSGYLVKLADGASNVTLQVTGQPVPANHQWLSGSYNLAGFPVNPGAAPTVALYFADTPVSEVRRLGNDGRWSPPLGGGELLQSGEVYLVYYDDDDPDAPDDYTAPLIIIDHVEDGMQLAAGFDGSSTDFRIENMASVTAVVTLSLVDGANASVALRLTEPVTQELKAGAATLTLGAGQAKRLVFAVRSFEQSNDGDALLEIASAQLGTRWLVPVRAKRGDYAGLWVGDVVVNDVSEGRLGGTNVENGELTVALRPRDLSGLQGAVQLTEMAGGSTPSVVVTATLGLATPEEILPLDAIVATAPYVAGYVFVDANQNGQRDGDEQGLAGVTVTLGSVSTETAEDGLYVFEGLAPGTYSIAPNAAPAGYTSDFPVMLPQTTTLTSNAVPTSVQIGAMGIDGLEPPAYGSQVLAPPYTLPQFDADDNRIEPLLNYGYVSTYDVSLWTGQCSDRWEKRKDLDPMLNGVLLATVDSAALNPGYAVDDLLLGSPSYVLYIEKQGAGGADGQGIACGEIVVGAPTKFANGDGSEFRFRVLLRVDENGVAELLPDYLTTEGKRVSSAAFSMVDPLVATGVDFGDMSGLLDFSLLLDPDDPLNPYKHKYSPDHDNLDAKFNPMDFDAVSPHLWEAYEVRRRIQLELTELPPMDGATAAIAAELDWGGLVWGGRYKEVISGIHKNAITVKGYFVVRHALAWEDLTPQAYDQAGGGGK